MAALSAKKKTQRGCPNTPGLARVSSFDEGIDSRVLEFADRIQVFRVVGDERDQDALQPDLRRAYLTSMLYRRAPGGDPGKGDHGSPPMTAGRRGCPLTASTLHSLVPFLR